MRYDSGPMKTTVERESPTKLRLLIEVEPGEIAPLYDRTLRRLAQEVKVPGFRKGKVPRPILETRLGKDAVREEVLRDALPALFAEAAGSESLRPLTLPQIQVESFEEGQPLTFTATIEVRPEITLPEYVGIEVEGTPVEATEEELKDQLERLRERFATLEVVARNAARGDHVLVDVTAYQHADKIEAASARDLLYEVGSGTIVPELDEELEGKRTGDILKVNAVLPERYGPPHGGQEVSFSVIVKEVHAKRLPPLDDDFARTASEFDTMEELEAELRKRIEAFKSIQAQVELREKVLEDLLERTDVPVPESMLDREMQARIGTLLRDLEGHNMTLADYLKMGDMGEEQLVKAYRSAAERAVAAELLLEAIARAEELEVTREEIDEEIVRAAERMKRPADEVRRELEESGRVDVLAGDILRRKALSYLVEHARVLGQAS